MLYINYIKVNHENKNSLSFYSSHFERMDKFTIDIQYIYGNRGQYFIKELAILRFGSVSPKAYHLLPSYPKVGAANSVWYKKNKRFTMERRWDKLFGFAKNTKGFQHLWNICEKKNERILTKELLTRRWNNSTRTPKIKWTWKFQNWT